MIIIENKIIEQIPVLHIVRKKYLDTKLPFVIFVHGFTSAKENNLHYAYHLAEKGFRVVLPEAAYHGERGSNLSKEQLALHFWDIVLQSIDEMDLIKQHFEGNHLIDTNRIGLVGTSMGGIITLGSLTRYDWIKAAVSLMGMPYYEKFALFQINHLKKNGFKIPLSEESIKELFVKLKAVDLSVKPERLEKRPLLFWHGKKDPVVPFTYTYDFYESIKPLYRDHPEKLQFIVDEHSGHKVSREGLIKTVEWFDQYLA